MKNRDKKWSKSMDKCVLAYKTQNSCAIIVLTSWKCNWFLESC